MKKLIYIFSVLFLVLSSCQDEVTPLQTEEIEGEFVTMSFSATIPDFIVATKAEGDIVDMYLLNFDKDGKFLGRVQANTTTQTATVPIKTRIIHFVANYEWDGWTDSYIESLIGQHETVIIPPMATSRLGYWGRSKVTSLYGTIPVVLLRNYAKVTVELGAGVSNFEIAGYALGHYATKGAVATYEESGSNPEDLFKENNNEVLTLPTSMTYADADDSYSAGEEPYMTNKEKYMFESPNTDANPIFVIVKNGNGRYYKVHFLKDDEQKTHWQIERNYHYKVIIRNFTDEINGGYDSYTEAKTKAPANDLYAEIVKESPVIGDLAGNKLEMEKMVYIFTSGGTLNTTANYSINQSGNMTISNSYVQAAIIEDNDNILSNLQVVDGTITATVAEVSSGQKEAKIRVYETKNNALSRVITIISTEKYNFNATPIITYAGRDADINIEFSIPDNYPTELLPVECKIEATTLYPVEANKNMLIVHENETYYYIYEAFQTGSHSVTFKTSLDDSNGTVKIVNDYFTTATVELISTVQTIKLGGRYRYADTPTGNGNNISGGTITVNYSSASQISGNVSFTTGTYGAANKDITIPVDAENIELSYNRGGDEYILSVTVADLKSTDNKVLRMPVKFVDVTLGGTFRTGVRSFVSTYNQTNIPSGDITLSYTSSLGNDEKSFNTNDAGGVSDVTLSLPSDASVSLSYTIEGITYTATGLSIATLTGTDNKDLTTAGTQYRIRGGYYRGSTSANNRISNAITLSYAGGSLTFNGGNQTDVYVYVPTNATVNLSHSHTSGTYTYGPVAISSLTTYNKSHIMTKQ